MSRWIPDAKVLAGGIAGVLAWMATIGLASAGVEIPAETVGALVAAVMALVAYLVPPSTRDIIKRVDDTIIDLARQSPDSPATAPKVAAE